jgi:hypothetical protein
MILSITPIRIDSRRFHGGLCYCFVDRELSLNILFLQVRWESKTSDSQDTKKSRWKFLFGGTLVALLLQLNNLAQGKIPSNAEGYGSVIGSAIAGFLVG